ncbi:MAG: NAD(P)/FAD-dependent oxidoreductase [Cyanobacteria bacterium REEB67]|nr:NAD(P)/FAD-dependent oxidoreductase [Cyanobacteria bacterium REEB67]
MLTPPDTTSPDQSLQRSWDVVIIGAGPAGAVSAYQLARLGKKVLLVDKASFPRDKVCGSCLSARTLGYLTEAGLGHVVSELGAQPIGNLHLRTAGGASTIAFPIGFAVSRQSLDQAIVEKAQSVGALFLPSTTALVGALAGSTRTVILETAGVYTAVQSACVLVCDGVNGRALNELSSEEKDRFKPTVSANSRIGSGAVVSLPDNEAGLYYRPGTIYMALDKNGYVGIVCMENNKIDLAGAFEPAYTRMHGSTRAAAAKILRDAGLPFLHVFETAEWLGTAPYTRHRETLAAERLFIVGDAASYGEPFTGEGIGWAVKSALLAVPLVERALAGWDNSLVGEWQRIHKTMVANRQRLSLTLGGWLRHEFSITTLVRLLRIAPILAGPFVNAINRCSPDFADKQGKRKQTFKLSMASKVGQPK